MTENIQGIALRIVKYSDSSSMATLWTRQFGRMSVVMPSGTGREAQRRRALMMPMRVFEGVAKIKSGNDVGKLYDISPVWTEQSTDPTVGVISIFLSDFLYAVLKDSSADPLLSDYIFESARLMQTLRGTALANFHLMFLYKLGHFIGIEPDMGSYGAGKYFDMRDATFTVTTPLHAQYLNKEESYMAYVLSRLNVRNMGLMRLTKVQRNRMLDTILDYYTLHLTPVNQLKSLSIVRDIFA